MANYRQIHTKIWKDQWFLDLEPEYKLLFIYLFSNERASISGIYELPKRVIAFEAGLDMDTLEKGIQVFEEAGKAYVRDGVVWVKNLRKYHETKSPKVQTRILSDLDEVKECELKGIYRQEYGIDKVSENENSVSIPPYIYKSSLVKSKSNGQHSDYEQPPEAAPFPEVHEKRQEMIAAIAAEVKTVFAIGVNSDEFEQIADGIIAKGIEPEQVRGFYQNHWREHGHYGGKPALKSLLQEIDNYAGQPEPTSWMDDIVLDYREEIQ